MNQTESIIQLSPDKKQSTRYQKIKLYFSVISGIINLIIPVIFLISGGSEKLRNLSVDFGYNYHVTILIYMAVFSLGLVILHFPFDIFSGFIIEKKFKLSRLSIYGWLIDWAKGTFIGNTFIILIISGIYWLLKNQPQFWWIWSSIAAIIIILILSALIPIVILPIFYKFEPIEEGRLKNRLFKLTNKIGTKIQGVYIWHLSEKTSKSNAAVTGWGKTRRIIISDTLIKSSTEKEIEVVMAHEIGHHVNKDIWKMMFVNLILVFISFYTIDLILYKSIEYFNLISISDIAGLPLLIIVTAIISLIALPASNWISRRYETNADIYALEITGMQNEFISAMNKLAEQNLSEKQPNSIIEFIFYSHPSVYNRISNAKKWKNNG